MGSDIASHLNKPAVCDVPNIPLHLAKVPEDYAFGGDKGFTGIEIDFPNVNAVDTLPQVANSKTHWLSAGQIKLEIPITKTRAPCKTVFFRTSQ